MRFACIGAHPTRRFVRAGENTPGTSHLYLSYRQILTHTDPVIRRIAALVRSGRLAAETTSGK